MALLPLKEHPLWRESYPDKSLYPRLVEDLKVDVVIIGAGITGLSSAYMLKQAGMTVAVVEKNTVGSGTTGRTTGKVTSQHNLCYDDFLQRLGADTARVYAEANQAGLERVSEIITKEKIDCDWERDAHYVYTTDPAQIKKFKDEARVAAGLGLPASFETSTPLPFEVKAAVKFANQGKFNSQKYVLGLARAVHGDGSFVFEHSMPVRIHDGNPSRIRTLDGSVTAKAIIMATNPPAVPLMARGGYCIMEYPTESYIVAGQPDKEVSGMYISPDKDNYSILPIAVDGESWLLVGGAGGNLPGFSGNRKARYMRLANYAEKHFGIREVKYHWSDRDYIAYDNIPLVGKVYPWSKNLYVGTAFKKWGLTNGTVAGMILTDILTGKKNPWASTFDSTRTKPILSIPHAAVQYFKG